MSRHLALLLALAAVPAPALADALVRTQAMSASTIAELFVEDERIRVELEIGQSDLAAFRDLLPDGLIERLGLEAEPLPERLATELPDGDELAARGLARRKPWRS